MQGLGMFRSWQKVEIVPNPGLKMLRFPLQRGYARAPLRWIAPYQKGMLKRLLAQTGRPEESPLVCSTPFYVPVAELWPGPVIYYVTDLNVAYDGLNPSQVRSLDLRMCRVAWAVCPNSRRIADYLIREAACDPAKITVIPNATRESNILPRPRYEPAPLPEDVQDLPRPIAGVLGDLSGNMNWELIADTIQRTPRFSWLFVGPTNRAIGNRRQRVARAWAMKHARFVGMKLYGELQAYASCLDVAVLPYMKKEPTYSGSSTRFYEHLAAGRPMVATRGFAELLEKEPLLTLVDTPEEMAAALERLRSMNFRDGYEDARWEASKLGTWEQRARTMRMALQAAGGPAVEREQTVASVG
jgi:glycosyltransferase involved in cell wall biosynthesis